MLPLLRSITSLFTNVPIDGFIKAAERALVRMDEGEFGLFEFRGREYEEIQGLAMGSPLSAVLVHRFMETLEADHYQKFWEETWSGSAT